MFKMEMRLETSVSTVSVSSWGQEWGATDVQASRFGVFDHQPVV